MILYELMELERPYDSSVLKKLVKKVKKGDTKPLKTKRPQPLIDLYDSMRNLVCLM
jgi:hypothetical protein